MIALPLPRISTNVRFSELAGSWAERLFLTPPRPRDAAATALDLIDARSAYVEHKRRLIARSEEHTSELQSLAYLVCRLLLEKKKKKKKQKQIIKRIHIN